MATEPSSSRTSALLIRINSVLESARRAVSSSSPSCMAVKHALDKLTAVSASLSSVNKDANSKVSIGGGANGNLAHAAKAMGFGVETGVTKQPAQSFRDKIVSVPSGLPVPVPRAAPSPLAAQAVEVTPDKQRKTNDIAQDEVAGATSRSAEDSLSPLPGFNSPASLTGGYAAFGASLNRMRAGLTASAVGRDARANLDNDGGLARHASGTPADSRGAGDDDSDSEFGHSVGHAEEDDAGGYMPSVYNGPGNGTSEAGIRSFPLVGNAGVGTGAGQNEDDALAVLQASGFIHGRGSDGSSGGTDVGTSLGKSVQTMPAPRVGTAPVPSKFAYAGWGTGSGATGTGAGSDELDYEG